MVSPIDPHRHASNVKSILGSTILTPSNHRTQLGPAAQSSSLSGFGNSRQSTAALNRGSQSQTTAQRQPFASISGNGLQRSGAGGYGMSAGVKVGRQQTGQAYLSNVFHLLISSKGSHMLHNANQGNLGDQSAHRFNQSQQFVRDGGSYL